MYGLPLRLFGKDVLFMPMFTLNDIDLLSGSRGYTIGTTNILIFQMPQIQADAYFNIDEGKLTVKTEELKPLLKSTEKERAIISKFLKVPVYRT